MPMMWFGWLFGLAALILVIWALVNLVRGGTPFPRR